MKKLQTIILTGALVCGLSSCNDYLDVNTDPDSPTSETASPQLRLPWIQNYLDYALGTAYMRAGTAAGTFTQTSTTSSNGMLAKWDPLQGTATTVYQNFYLGAGVNVAPLIAAAEAQKAYHYAGAACISYALGFMTLLDLHGEIPMSEAFTGKYNPAYDDGKALFNQCMEYLDKGIAYLKMKNENIALSEGDIWNNGDANKWLKLAYGLKARYLLKLSKKSDLYKPDEILAAVANGPQSNADNTSVKCYNVEGDQTNVTIGDPYQTNPIWDCAAYGTSQRLTKWYISLLNNSFTGGSGVIDPRLTKLVPAAMTHVKLDADGNLASFQWTRDKGIDMLTPNNPRLNGNIINATYASNAVKLTYTVADATARNKFVADMKTTSHAVETNGNDVVVTYAPGQIYCNTTNYLHAGDTCYVNMRSNSMSTSGRSATDMYYYPIAGKSYVAGTGTFYTRPNSDFDIMTYSEMCFIKAEVLFRKGDKGGALDAYRKGIQANFDRLQAGLKQWQSDGTTSDKKIGENPDMLPMKDADITAYMSSAAVAQNAAQLTMADIMRQKIIAMGGLNLEVWNDMRRFNYSAGNIENFGNIYPDFARPSEFTASSKIIGKSPSDPTYWLRRWTQSSLERDYNLTQVKASNKLALTDPIWSCPVWWDCATDSEYYGYIGK